MYCIMKLAINVISVDIQKVSFAVAVFHTIALTYI